MQNAQCRSRAQELSDWSGFVTACVAIAVGVTGALGSHCLLGTQPPLIREPVAQSVGATLAWLSAWPWMQEQDSRIVRRVGFVGYAIWIAIGMAAIAAIRVYLGTG